MSSIIIDDPAVQKQWASNNVGCHSLEHNPPTHIHIPHGKMMIHTCPQCGKVVEVRSNVALY